MLAEFVRTLVDLGQLTTDVQIHQHPEFPGRVWVQHGDNLEQEDAPPPLRQHELHSYDDLVTALKDSAIAPAPEVYIGSQRIIVLLDRNERRSRITVDLVESVRLKLCREFEARPKVMHPRDAVKVLRFDFHGGQHAHMIQGLSRLDFTRTSAGKSHVEHGKESLGRSVEQAVQQADQVPDRFLVGVPAWTNSGFSRYAVNVEFGCYIDLENQAVELRVLSDECTRLMNQALNAVAKDLREALPTVPVFLGAP